MELPWKEYVCNDCGNSSGILDVDRDIPKGWIITGVIHTIAINARVNTNTKWRV